MKHYAMASVKVPDNEPADAFPGTFEVILSTPEVDRDGESVAKGAFDPLPDHVSFDRDHGMSVDTTVGSGVPRYDGDALKVSGTWSSIPEAQKVRTLVREGHIRSTSVAFMGAEYETREGTPTITKAEILNGAFTPVPSNRGASVISAKTFAEKVAVGDTVPHFKGHGMTASDLSTALQKAIEEAHGGERVYTYLRDYTDEWAVFGVYSMKAPDRLLQQNYTVSGNEAKMTGDATEVVAKVIYEPVESEAPKSVESGDRSEKSAPSPDDVASALAEARAAIAQGEAALALA